MGSLLYLQKKYFSWEMYKMNILITSVGIRGYLVRYFQETLKNGGKIFAADCSEYSPALYGADDYFILPNVSNKNYVNKLIEICGKNEIEGIVSLNDLELPILAKNKSKFSDKGIEVIVSEPNVVDICYDKYKTFMFLKQNGFSTPKTFVSLEKSLEEIEKGDLGFPLLIKPIKGSASIDIKKIYNKKELQNEFDDRKDIIIQEFVEGDEYGVDVFNNTELTPIGIFAKKKIKMRSGETDKAISVYDEGMIEVIGNVAKKLGFYGPADIDLFKRGNEYLIMEINPRFGGGYPLSHALGAKFPDKIISLINKTKLEPDYFKYPNNVLMMKQYEIVIKKCENLV